MYVLRLIIFPTSENVWDVRLSLVCLQTHNYTVKILEGEYVFSSFSVYPTVMQIASVRRSSIQQAFVNGFDPGKVMGSYVIATRWFLYRNIPPSLCFTLDCKYFFLGILKVWCQIKHLFFFDASLKSCYLHLGKKKKVRRFVFLKSPF